MTDRGASCGPALAIKFNSGVKHGKQATLATPEGCRMSGTRTARGGASFPSWCRETAGWKIRERVPELGEGHGARYIRPAWQLGLDYRGGSFDRGHVALDGISRRQARDGGAPPEGFQQAASGCSRGTRRDCSGTVLNRNSRELDRDKRAGDRNGSRDKVGPVRMRRSVCCPTQQQLQLRQMRPSILATCPDLRKG